MLGAQHHQHHHRVARDAHPADEQHQQDGDHLQLQGLPGHPAQGLVAAAAQRGSRAGRGVLHRPPKPSPAELRAPCGGEWGEGGAGSRGAPLPPAPPPRPGSSLPFFPTVLPKSRSRPAPCTHLPCKPSRRASAPPAPGDTPPPPPPGCSGTPPPSPGNHPGPPRTPSCRDPPEPPPAAGTPGNHQDLPRTARDPPGLPQPPGPPIRLPPHPPPAPAGS